MSGLCERPGCSLPGEASYGMVAEELTFWIDHLDPAARAGVLCRKHADSMSVPRGWTLIDRREADLHLFSLRPPRVAIDTPPRTRPETPRPRLTKSPDEPHPAPDERVSGPVPAAPRRAARGGSGRGEFEQLPMMLSITETVGEDVPRSAADPPPLAPPQLDLNTWPSPPGEAIDGSTPLASPAAEAGLGSPSVATVGVEDATGDLPLLNELTWDDVQKDADTDAEKDAANDDPNKPWMPTFDQSDDLDGMLDVATPLLRRAFRGGTRK